MPVFRDVERSLPCSATCNAPEGGSALHKDASQQECSGQIQEKSSVREWELISAATSLAGEGLAKPSESEQEKSFALRSELVATTTSSAEEGTVEPYLKPLNLLPVDPQSTKDISEELEHILDQRLQQTEGICRASSLQSPEMVTMVNMIPRSRIAELQAQIAESGTDCRHRLQKQVHNAKSPSSSESAQPSCHLPLPGHTTDGDMEELEDCQTCRRLKLDVERLQTELGEVRQHESDTTQLNLTLQMEIAQLRRECETMQVALDEERVRNGAMQAEKAECQAAAHSAQSEKNLEISLLRAKLSEQEAAARRTLADRYCEMVEARSSAQAEVAMFHSFRTEEHSEMVSLREELLMLRTEAAANQAAGLSDGFEHRQKVNDTVQRQLSQLQKQFIDETKNMAMNRSYSQLPSSQLHGPSCHKENWPPGSNCNSESLEEQIQGEKSPSQIYKQPRSR